MYMRAAWPWEGGKSRTPGAISTQENCSVLPVSASSLWLPGIRSMGDRWLLILPPFRKETLAPTWSSPRCREAGLAWPAGATAAVGFGAGTTALLFPDGDNCFSGGVHTEDVKFQHKQILEASQMSLLAEECSPLREGKYAPKKLWHLDSVGL
ncbi:hypothetical protein E2320_013219 [Naja naja]|nr:hypothetical protein E2320_013219 [Naja naja]